MKKYLFIVLLVGLLFSQSNKKAMVKMGPFQIGGSVPTKPENQRNCISDNESLVETAYSTNSLADYRLRIDMACIRNMISNNEIASLRWIKTQSQLADCLTKQGASCQNLIDVLHTNTLRC